MRSKRSGVLKTSLKRLGQALAMGSLGLLMGVAAYDCNLLDAAYSQQTAPAITANGIDFPLQNPPGAVSSASITRIGNPGLRTLYYWIVVNSTFGQGKLAGPFVLSQAGNSFGASYAVASGTYTSGITANGTVGHTCDLTGFNHGSTASATVALTGNSTIAGGTALVITDGGFGATSAPTSATAHNGTAICSGTATVATVLGHNYSTGATVQWSPVSGATSYDCLRTSTATLPAGTGAYAVQTGLTSPGCIDTSEMLSSYTVSPADASAATKLLQNPATGNRTSCLAINGRCIGFANATVNTTVYYQTVLNGTTPLPQEPALSFSSSGFTLTDTAGNRTNVALGALASAPCSSYASNATAGCSVTINGDWLEWVKGSEIDLSACSVGSPGASPAPYSGLCSEPYITLSWPVAFTSGCFAPSVSDNNHAVDTPNSGSGQTYVAGAWMVIGNATVSNVTVQRSFTYSDSGVHSMLTHYDGFPIAYCIGR